jgi:glutamate synthase (NADPH) small chain
MAERLLKFVTLDAAMPSKRAPSERVGDFREIYGDFIVKKAEEQASRCSQCGVPFCQTGCPLQNNIPDWLKLTAEGRMEEAFEMSSATNAMPEICGRICPQDRLCEGACVIEQSGHGAVTIGAVERYITDTAWDNGWVEPIRPVAERRESIGIIGAGPGGLAAADGLRSLGYQVTIYDRYDRAGGLLIYGIPGFKLEKPVVERRVQRLVDSGVTFRLKFEVGRDATFDELRQRHDAVLIATGVYKARELALPGAGGPGVVRALDYLTAANRVDLGDQVPGFDDGTLNAAGRRVVVIGGGDTAMDCVRTAVRQGAVSVTCLYRRDRANMPGSAREVANAEDEGVEFQWLSAPKAILATADGVTGVRVQRMRLGEPDGAGRQLPIEIAGAVSDRPADLVIQALGFEAEDIPAMFGCPELPLRADGTIATRGDVAVTAMPGVFAAGDIVRGASLVVWAVKDGQTAASEIHQYLKQRSQVARAA